MPRIRTIKPEFWGDEKLGPLPPIDRLVFLGLVSMADDCGRLLDSVKVIDAFVFPHTDDTCGPSLESLANLSRIARGTTSSGQRVLQIINWTKHQKVDHPNTKAALPQLVAEPRVMRRHTEIRESLATASRPARDSTSTNDQRPTTTDRRADHGVPLEILDLDTPYFSDTKTRTARMGAVRGMLQGITDHPVPVAVITRAIREMAVAGADFRPVVLKTWCERAAKEFEKEAGAKAAQETLKGQSSVVGQPHANGGHSGGFSEDEVAG